MTRSQSGEGEDRRCIRIGGEVMKVASHLVATLFVGDKPQRYVFYVWFRVPLP